jgi:hypothetical protein
VIGGSPLRTAQGFVAPVASAEIVRCWGEALWTAPNLADEEYQRILRSASVRFLFGLPGTQGVEE